MENDRITLKVNGAELTFIQRRRPTWRNVYYTQRDWNRDWREYHQAPRLYVRVADETILENLENRRRRPYNVYKKMIAASGIGSVLNLESLRWSQHAGCEMCSCSPGFIIGKQRITIGAMEFADYDVWVTLDGAPSVDERKPARVIA
jgi:hypothetical protein